MEDLLTASISRPITKADDQLIPSTNLIQKEPEQSSNVQSPDDVLRIIQSKPNTDALVRCLKWLASPDNELRPFNIRLPGAQGSRIIYVLINDIVNDFWHVWDAESRPRKLLLKCLTSVAGISAAVTKLRNQISRDGEKKLETVSRPSTSQDVQSFHDTIGLLESILEKPGVVNSLWTEIHVSTANTAQASLLWKELVSLLAAGRLLSVVSEAHNIQSRISHGIILSSWLTNGSVYAEWLGREILAMAEHKKQLTSEQRVAVTQLLTKALTLGYIDHVVDAVFGRLLAGEVECLDTVAHIIYNLTTHEQRKIIISILRSISRKISSVQGDRAISGWAALLQNLVDDKPNLQNALIEWLTSASGGAVSTDVNTRRVVLAALSSHTVLLRTILHKALEQFGDKLYIKHTPVLHQEVNAQVLLLVVGLIYRSDPSLMRSTMQSSIYIKAISNRLAASSPRSQFLGMVVGTAVSELVDSEDNIMHFSMQEIDSNEGLWYRSLCKYHDTIGSLDDFRAVALHGKQLPAKSPTKEPPRSRTVPPKPSIITSKIISIEEVDEIRSEDDSLPMYEKPDSDPEDEDEDATLVQRNKPTAPVYVRDLVAGLRDTENYDRHRLSLSTAASLIRRKAKFGTEVTDHIEELATQLVGLGNKFNIEKFAEMRLQSMIAVLVAQPLRMGQWFSKTYFNGEYSMGQRASILTTLSMGARELAEYRDEDAALTGAVVAPEELFPSKKLPDKYHKIYTIDAAPVNAIAKQLEKTLIQPMAIEAADTMAGPNALKVRTFSSRMEVEKKRKRAIPNELAKIVAEGFFFPLTGLWRIQAQTRGSANVFTHPFLLTHFLKTLSLIISASGASTLSLPTLTTEFWSLLLSLRTTALCAPPVLEALLFSFLTLLEINSNNQRALADDHAKELLETQAWAEQVFEKIGGGSEEGERIRMLAAAVLVRTKEVVEKYQRLLLGDLVEFM